ncbi:MAG: AraC family ligand binding domain-containing protein [Clostridia bacterium]|nr:AraC family ligand binding domain-containing protein [Clostridia bacterium]
MKILKQKNYIPENFISASEKTISSYGGTHGHDFFEIEFVLFGSGSYVIDGKNYEIKKGELFFMSPADFHEVISDEVGLINVMFAYDFSVFDFISNITCVI